MTDVTELDWEGDDDTYEEDNRPAMVHQCIAEIEDAHDTQLDGLGGWESGDGEGWKPGDQWPPAVRRVDDLLTEAVEILKARFGEPE